MVTNNAINSNTPIELAKGGTNASSMTNTDGVVYYDGTRLVTTAVGTATHILTSNGVGVAPTFQAAAGGGGITVQQVYASTTAYATGTTAIPVDDTIPQKTEGSELLTVTITPTNSSNLLLIRFVGNVYRPSANAFCALFQDATTNALSANFRGNSGVDTQVMVLEYRMVAGTTSATTFRIRMGLDTTAAWQVNSCSLGSRCMGGVACTVLTVTELSV